MVSKRCEQESARKVEVVSKRVRARSKHGTPGSTAQLAAERLLPRERCPAPGVPQDRVPSRQ